MTDKVSGYICKVISKDDPVRVVMAQLLYGRICYKNTTKGLVAYYLSGLLDNCKFYRFQDGSAFMLEDGMEIIINTVQLTGPRYKIIFTRHDTEQDLPLKTGRQYYEDLSKIRGAIFHVRKRRNKIANGTADRTIVDQL